MSAKETEKLTKTELILAHICEHGPKSEYDLYKELPGVSHGTIHFCLKKLTDQGALTIIPVRKREKRPKKLYNLTFMGTITYLASHFPRPEMGVAEDEEDEYWENFEEELQEELVEFLERQGRLQKYAPFQEIRWLCDHFSGVVEGFVIVAAFIINHRPYPYKKPLVFLAFQATGRKDNEEEADEMKDLICRMQWAFRDEFTKLFFQLMTFLRAKGRTTNCKLRKLAEEYLEERIHETWEIKRAIELFSKKKTSPRKH